MSAVERLPRQGVLRLSITCSRIPEICRVIHRLHVWAKDIKLILNHNFGSDEIMERTQMNHCYEEANCICDCIMHKIRWVDLHKANARAISDGRQLREWGWRLPMFVQRCSIVERENYQRESDALCSGSFVEELMCRRRFVRSMNLTHDSRIV